MNNPGTPEDALTTQEATDLAWYANGESDSGDNSQNTAQAAAGASQAALNLLKGISSPYPIYTIRWR